MGHFVRCASIAQALQEKGLQSHILTKSKAQFPDFGIEIQTISFDWQNQETRLLEFLSLYAVTILDSPSISQRLFNEIARTAKNFVSIDDYLRLKAESGYI